MKIAMVAPFEESVPPKKYGGTELVVYNLLTELVKRGHEVVLFGTGDSDVPCRVEAIYPTSIRTAPEYANDLKKRDSAKYLGIGKILSILEKEHYDIVHNHIGWRYLLFANLFKQPVVTTLHGPMSLLYQHVGFTSQPDLPFVSISDNQRKDFPDLKYIKTVYNGIDISLFEYNETPQDYLFFLGRFSPEKGIKEAIEMTRKTGNTLKIATKIDEVDRAYYESLKHMIDGTQISLIGEINFSEKIQLLKNAKALLAPIQWEEPFGLNVVEAMACGTPVLGIRRGSFGELITHGVDGFLADTAEELGQSIAAIPTIKRSVCRQTVEKRFTKEVMADGYLAVYDQILQKKT